MKGFILNILAYCSSLSKEVRTGTQRTGTWRQELIQMPQRSDAYWLAPHSMFLLLLTQDHQVKDTTNHNGLGPPPSITNSENALQPNLMEAFPQMVPYFQITRACVKLGKPIQHRPSEKSQILFAPSRTATISHV